MYYNDFDFIEFFKDKYKKIRISKVAAYSSDGIGGVGIITQKQMILRFNEPDLDLNTNTYIKGAGHHYDEENIHHQNHLVLIHIQV